VRSLVLGLQGELPKPPPQPAHFCSQWICLIPSAPCLKDSVVPVLLIQNSYCSLTSYLFWFTFVLLQYHIVPLLLCHCTYPCCTEPPNYLRYAVHSRYPGCCGSRACLTLRFPSRRNRPRFPNRSSGARLHSFLQRYLWHCSYEYQHRRAKAETGGSGHTDC
jgi:hypothetical protein